MQNFEPQLIDLHFQGTPGVVAVYVWDTGDGLALVDTGPGSTLEALKAGLDLLGAGWGDVRHILLTHIHFDHAGAAGQILDYSPRARVYVHERGARHLVSPERLYASAAQIYGDQMEALWGEMRPMDADRVTALAGGETLRLGGAEVRALYTPGHAVHHLAYVVGDELYTGDVGASAWCHSSRPARPHHRRTLIWPPGSRVPPNWAPWTCGGCTWPISVPMPRGQTTGPTAGKPGTRSQVDAGTAATGG
ncbi:MBL fold metallo-hydrolase [Deinococcus radiophilus]|uniref:MBL fold metallo-hydrolase n=1 Tax=Deinococcus radiophilus TaxID=32062 RepID=UPI00361B4566